MAPSKIDDHVDAHVDVDALNARAASKKPLLVAKPHPPPVADDYMYDFKYNHALPTTAALGVEFPADCNAQKEAEGIVQRLADALACGSAQAFADLFLEYGVWRDKLSFTWDQRTFNFRPAILKAATDLLPTTKAYNFQFLKPAPEAVQPYPDFGFLQFVVSFETHLVHASAVIKAVYTNEGWSIYTMHTVAEQLNPFPERAPADGHMTGTTSWETHRAMEVDSADPEVLIIGGGQNGIALAARCKAIGLNCLIVEKGNEIGDIWKNRYEYLSLHFPHWADDLPFFRYPKHWPTFTPAQKQGIYMSWYASALELNAWTKSTVIQADQDEQGSWTVQINKGGSQTRTVNPKHIVMATSLCGSPYVPNIPGMDQYRAGEIRHSSNHDSARDFVGKKVCVVGTSSSGFDTAYDCSRRGIDVTLLQRSPTYVMSLTHSVPRILGGYGPDAEGNRKDPEEHDRVFFSTPTGPGEELGRRTAETLEELDRPLLEALNEKGLRTWRGQRGTGNSTLGQTRNGGFYFDAGACKEIVEGRIKVEPGYIERFTEDKVFLNDGRERHFDLIVFATGFSNLVDSIRDTLGPRIANSVGPVWGIDEEGEPKNAFRETGVPNLWIMVGFLPMTRYQSRILALRLKALTEGISPPPYKS
ncbi:putative flavin-containing monooxygenase YUCCA3 [Hortaea werneckii]|nr:putative flavin-containing monooxygenase YUCCA3 [Hortaea werneckii]